MDDLSGARIHITGVVQGVGFRPFVYALAQRMALKGWVRNTSAGVDIEVDGSVQTLQAFIQALAVEAPPLARIDDLQWEPIPSQDFQSFEIIHSQPIPDAFQPISPDVSTCPDCLRELFDPADRRYLYPFINCTNCGPRFTIIADIPYDRPKTTMASFLMCPDCAAEYRDPLDRRFHAQPTACPVCGPQVWLELDGQTALKGTEAILEVQRLLKSGKVVAIKGLGGFHLACDAFNPQAVVELRERKLRVDKPFALMMPDPETIRSHCFANPAEIELLESRQRPIVILLRRPGSLIASQVAPNQNTLGVMLPYTPLHHLLFAQDIRPGEKDLPSPALVMTSGNLSEEPIATDNDEARQRLGSLADAFLMHDRPIRTRCDDSVMRIFELPAGAAPQANPTTLMPLRRSRGYAPFPVRLPKKTLPLLAVGAELKNTFCILRDQYAFLSHYIGDMENYETYQSFTDGVDHFERLFRIHPQALAYDLHPNYLATRYALERAGRDGLPAIPVQHHYAHIAACMAEHGLHGDQPVIGVSFDGTGYGEDGAIWGGEILIADYRVYQRPYHLAYVALPGGDKAVREPWRMALAWLSRANVAWTEQLPPVRFAWQELPDPERQLGVLQRQIETGLNAPFTSSMGRLFDAIAALLGIRQIVNYEAQAAIELEALVDPGECGSYPIYVPGMEPLGMSRGAATKEIDPSPMFHALLRDLVDGVPVSLIAARFHNSLALLVLQACQNLRLEYQIESVALSGGVWQNMTLLEKTVHLLSQHHFTVLFHQQVPTNDGGISLGQAVIAANRLGAGEMEASALAQRAGKM